MTRAVQFGFHGRGAPAPTSSKGAQPAANPPGNESGCEAGSVAVTGTGDTRIVQIAESQVGVRGHPDGSNCTKYGPCEEWCALFTAWVWQHAGIDLPGGTSPWGYSGTIYTWVKAHGGRDLPATATPAPGDAVFYGTGPLDSVHVGIVTRVLKNGEIETVEGNYDNRVERVGPFPPPTPPTAGRPHRSTGTPNHQPPAPLGRSMTERQGADHSSRNTPRGSVRITVRSSGSPHGSDWPVCRRFSVRTRSPLESVDSPVVRAVSASCRFATSLSEGDLL